MFRDSVSFNLAVPLEWLLLSAKLAFLESSMVCLAVNWSQDQRLSHWATYCSIFTGFTDRILPVDGALKGHVYASLCAAMLLAKLIFST